MLEQLLFRPEFTELDPSNEILQTLPLVVNRAKEIKTVSFAIDSSTDSTVFCTNTAKEIVWIVNQSPFLTLESEELIDSFFHIITNKEKELQLQTSLEMALGLSKHPEKAKDWLDMADSNLTRFEYLTETYFETNKDINDHYLNLRTQLQGWLCIAAINKRLGNQSSTAESKITNLVAKMQQYVTPQASKTPNKFIDQMYDCATEIGGYRKVESILAALDFTSKFQLLKKLASDKRPNYEHNLISNIPKEIKDNQHLEEISLEFIRGGHANLAHDVIAKMDSTKAQIDAMGKVIIEIKNQNPDDMAMIGFYYGANLVDKAIASPKKTKELKVYLKKLFEHLENENCHASLFALLDYYRHSKLYDPGEDRFDDFKQRYINTCLKIKNLSAAISILKELNDPDVIRYNFKQILAENLDPEQLQLIIELTTTQSLDQKLNNFALITSNQPIKIADNQQFNSLQNQIESEIQTSISELTPQNLVKISEIVYLLEKNHLTHNFPNPNHLISQIKATEQNTAAIGDIKAWNLLTQLLKDPSPNINGPNIESMIDWLNENPLHTDSILILLTQENAHLSLQVYQNLDYVDESCRYVYALELVINKLPDMAQIILKDLITPEYVADIVDALIRLKYPVESHLIANVFPYNQLNILSSLIETNQLELVTSLLDQPIDISVENYEDKILYLHQILESNLLKLIDADDKNDFYKLIKIFRVLPSNLDAHKYFQTISKLASHFDYDLAREFIITQSQDKDFHNSNNHYFNSFFFSKFTPELKRKLLSSQEADYFHELEEEREPNQVFRIFKLAKSIHDQPLKFRLKSNGEIIFPHSNITNLKELNLFLKTQPKKIAREVIKTLGLLGGTSTLLEFLSEYGVTKQQHIPKWLAPYFSYGKKTLELLYQDKFPQVKDFLKIKDLNFLKLENKWHQAKTHHENADAHVMEQISRAVELEKTHPGSVSLLFNHNGIANFGRLTVEQLFDQVNLTSLSLTNQPLPPCGLILFTASDHNGGVEAGLPKILNQVSVQLKPNNIHVRYFEFAGINEYFELPMMETNTSYTYQFGITSAHGTVGLIDTGVPNLFSDSEYFSIHNFDQIKMPWFSLMSNTTNTPNPTLPIAPQLLSAWFKRLFTPKAIQVVIACKSGAPNSFAPWLADHAGTVIGYPNSAGLKSIDFKLDSTSFPKTVSKIMVATSNGNGVEHQPSKKTNP